MNISRMNLLRKMCYISAQLLLKIFFIQQNEYILLSVIKVSAIKALDLSAVTFRSIKTQPNKRANIMTKKYLFALCLLIAGLTQPAFASKSGTKSIQQVEARVEQLRTAMINADAGKLKEVTSAELSYGHSGGHVESQSEFIEKIVSGRSDFVTIELREQTVRIVKDIAIVRHTLVGTTNDNGKPGEVNIGVMLIWQKHHGDWKLLARQAFKNH